MAINKAGIVNTNRTNKAELGLAAKYSCIAGREGAIVAPDITVRVLVNSNVIFIGNELNLG
ncbi:MAG: hypothetical protein Tsb0014_29200 [Pleurocapsa sp.]